MGDDVVAGLVELSHALRADVSLARTREEHIRVSARAHQAAQLAELARQTAQNPVSTPPEPVSSATHGGGELFPPFIPGY